jgi:hypothetical protein
MMLKTTGKYSMKRYRCTRCSRIEMHGTNHWGEFYDRCDGCSWKNPLDPIVTWECLEKMPKGYKKPEKWEKVKLGDIAKIYTIRKGKLRRVI